MVKLIYNYVKSVTRKYPSIHVFLPGVLLVHCAYEDQALGCALFYKPLWEFTVNKRGHYADSEDVKTSLKSIYQKMSPKWPSYGPK